MRIGYPCVNLGIGCTSARTFRLRSYSAALLQEKLAGNLDCLRDTLDWNAARGILFFRITSDLVPFASHPVCRFDWRRRFKRDLAGIGARIRRKRMRVSMHPDQFTLINSPDRGIFLRSVRELRYHAELLDAMELGASAKLQIHVGGVYGDREAAMRCFVSRYRELPPAVRRRLVIENDERCWPLADCLAIHRHTGVPVVCDVFHHQILNRGRRSRRRSASPRKRGGGATARRSSISAPRRPESAPGRTPRASRPPPSNASSTTPGRSTST